MSDHSDRYTFPPMGAYVRPGTLRLGHRAVREGLTALVSDTEAYVRVLKSVLEDFSEAERASARGQAVDAVLDQTWVMLGVLRGALSLFPRDLIISPDSDPGR